MELADLYDLALQPGDILGSSGAGVTSGFINLVTCALPGHGLSHVAMMAHANDGRLLVFESTSVLEDKPENYCEITGKYCSGVQAHTVDHFFSRPGKVWVFRKRKPLSNAQSYKLTKFLHEQIGKPYDLSSAMGSAGGKGRAWVRGKIFKQDLSQIYCSELCGAAVNLWLDEFDSASTWSPNNLMRYLVSDGVYYSAERVV